MVRHVPVKLLLSEKSKINKHLYNAFSGVDDLLKHVCALGVFDDPPLHHQFDNLFWIHFFAGSIPSISCRAASGSWAFVITCSREMIPRVNKSTSDASRETMPNFAPVWMSVA